MDIDKETQEKIRELQSFEQTLHSLLLQKQAFQMELNETENALSEISKTKGDIFKMVGSIMIKTDKDSVEKNLNRKKELLTIRLKSIENQEKNLESDSEKLKEEVMKKLK